MTKITIQEARILARQIQDDAEKKRAEFVEFEAKHSQDPEIVELCAKLKKAEKDLQFYISSDARWHLETEIADRILAGTYDPIGTDFDYETPLTDAIARLKKENEALKKNLIWTSQRPKVPGWYWIRLDIDKEDPEIVEFIPCCNGHPLLVDQVKGAKHLCGLVRDANSFCHLPASNKAWKRYEFAGPVIPPST